ncbi:MAG: energy transducer TonB [Bacteroidia bacterium]
MKKYFFAFLNLFIFVACNNASDVNSVNYTEKKDTLIPKTIVHSDTSQKNNSIQTNSLKKSDSTVNKNRISDTSKIAKPVRPKMYPLMLNPKYPGGIAAEIQFIADNLQYPEKALKNNISGTVDVDFRIMQDGSVTDIRVRHGIGFGCDEEAMRVIQLMKGWQIGGRISVPYGLPVKFELPKK